MLNTKPMNWARNTQPTEPLTREQIQQKYAPGQHMLFESNPGGETAPGTAIEGAQMMGREGEIFAYNGGVSPMGTFFDYSQWQQRQADGTPMGGQINPRTMMPNPGFSYPGAQGTQPAGTQPAGTQPAQPGSGAPQAIGANALMTAPTQWGERRDPVMPLQGYQNALLRGF